MGEKIKDGLKDFGQMILPYVKTLITVGLNGLYNYLKNKGEHKKYVQQQGLTQSYTLGYSQWRREFGYKNCFEKRKEYFDKKYNLYK